MTAKPKKPELKTTAAPKPATVNPKKNAGTNVKPVADKPNTSNLVVTPHCTTTPIEGISDLDNLLLEACVKRLVNY